MAAPPVWRAPGLPQRGTAPRATKNAVSVNVAPLADRVVVRSLDRNEQTRGGLFIPDTAKEKPQEGEILACLLYTSDAADD